jgi:hypothetical protein
MMMIIMGHEFEGLGGICGGGQMKGEGTER